MKTIPLDNTVKFIDKWAKIANTLKYKSLEKDTKDNWDIDIYPRSGSLCIRFRVGRLPLTYGSYWGEMILKFTNDHKETSKRGTHMVKGVRLTSKNQQWGKTFNKSMVFSKVEERLGNEFTEIWNDHLKKGFKFIEQENVAVTELDLVRKEVTDCGGVDIEILHGHGNSEWVSGQLLYKNSVSVKYTHGTDSQLSKEGRTLTINNITTEQMQTILKNLVPANEKTYLKENTSWKSIGAPMYQDGKEVHVMQADYRCTFADTTTHHPAKSAYTIIFTMDEYDQLPEDEESYLNGKRVIGVDHQNKFVHCPYCGNVEYLRNRLFSNVVVCKDTESFVEHAKQVRLDITHDKEGKIPRFAKSHDGIVRLDRDGNEIGEATIGFGDGYGED